MPIVVFTLIVWLFSMIIHEIAHGSVAYYLGDPTAKLAGRLTLNPLKHLDPIGSIIFPLFMFLATAGRFAIGWAIPVPINPYNLRDQKWGTLKVALAGPLTNFLIAVFFSLLIRFLILPNTFILFFSIIAIYNFAWAIFNLIPIPPFDGSWIFFALLPRRLEKIKIFFQRYNLVLLIFFIFFGLGLIFRGAAILYYLVSGSIFAF